MTDFADTSTATNAAIQLDDVHKVYPMGNAVVNALAGISHRFDRGSFWAVMGPSGSGKSTLLNLMGCLDRPTSGRCLIDGENVADLDDNMLSELRLRRIGFIFQNFNLIPQLTVSENIQLPLFYLGWDAHRSDLRAAELAQMLGLGDRLQHRPTELSGGQQQRVAIARSLANDPPILFADEPTGNLDSKTGQQILDLIIRLNIEGHTLVIVTHDADIAARASSRMYMHDGRVERIENGGAH